MWMGEDGIFYVGDQRGDDIEVPDRPSQLHIFVDGAWALDLPRARAEKWGAIKTERDRRTETGGYKVGAYWFHSDQKSRSQQLGLEALGANIPTNVMWKTMDGSFVVMTQVLAGQILAAAAVSDIGIFSAAELHKAAMEASADPAAYDLSTDWPKIYGE